MNRPSTPLISPEEWQALQAQPSSSAQDDVDVWFPLRVWFLLIITAVFAAALLLSAPQMSVYLAREPVLVEMLTRFLHFRGLMVVVSTLIGAWAYLHQWQLPRVFGLLSVIAVVNLVSDFFIIYPERLANPTVGFFLQLALRLLAIAALFACYRNARRVPDREHRFDLLLPFRQHPSQHWRAHG